jgi:23S rRNA pseudouridine955/2504/2580 synthase/23S rRNA pseudouridine1911/1915/1917 synthase
MSQLLHIPDHILFEDDVIIVVNKPHGLMVEPDRNGHPNLVQQVRNYRKQSLPAGDELYAQHIHRLDRPVRGIILFAKQRSVLKNLSEQFAERRVEKYYHALTDHRPALEKDTLQHWHRKEKKKAALYAQPVEYAEQASLRYEITEERNNLYRWNIALHTGKYHQIRAQLAAAGCPIMGDALYGSTVAYKPDAIALHAYRLVFHHPVTNKQLVFEQESTF